MAKRPKKNGNPIKEKPEPVTIIRMTTINKALKSKQHAYLCKGCSMFPRRLQHMIMHLEKVHKYPKEQALGEIEKQTGHKKSVIEEIE